MDRRPPIIARRQSGRVRPGGAANSRCVIEWISWAIENHRLPECPMPAGTVDESGALRMADSASGNDGLSRTEATGVANVAGPEHSPGPRQRYPPQPLFFRLVGAR